MIDPKNVLNLMKKNWTTYLLILLVCCAPPLLSIFRHGSDPDVIFYFGFFIVYGIASATTATEQVESKYEAYRIMATLPVSDREIVLSRFVRNIVLALGFIFLGWLMFSLYPPGPGLVPFSRSYIILAAITGLLLSGFAYAGLFRFGFTRLFRALMILIPVGIIIIFIFLSESFRDEIVELDPATFATYVKPQIMGLVVLIGLSVYSVIMSWAVKLKKRSKA